jgi:hypothetical protein
MSRGLFCRPEFIRHHIASLLDGLLEGRKTGQWQGARRFCWFVAGRRFSQACCEVHPVGVISELSGGRVSPAAAGPPLSLRARSTVLIRSAITLEGFDSISAQRVFTFSRREVRSGGSSNWRVSANLPSPLACASTHMVLSIVGTLFSCGLGQLMCWASLEA